MIQNSFKGLWTFVWMLDAETVKVAIFLLLISVECWERMSVPPKSKKPGNSNILQTLNSSKIHHPSYITIDQQLIHMFPLDF